MSKEKLSYCGGTCKENSAVVRLYNPTKRDETIIFSRAAFCLNNGCGWRLKYTDVQMSISYASDIESGGIRRYLRRTGKRFPKIQVNKIWGIWIALDVENFESYLREMKKVN